MIDCAAIIITPVGFEITAYSTDGKSVKGSYLRGNNDYQSIGANYNNVKDFCRDEGLVLALCNMVHPASEIADAIRKQKENQG